MNDIVSTYFIKNKYKIITYIDISVLFTNETLSEYLNDCCNKYPILKQHIGKTGKLEDIVDFKLTDHYKIIEESYENFDDYIESIDKSIDESIDESIELKWNVYYLTDINKKYRLYFIIDHSYADGYKLIEILASYFGTYKSPYKCSKIQYKNYIYSILGTIILCITFCINMIYICISCEKVNRSNKMDYIKCKPFILSEIKKCRNITVNDFLYSLMIKTDYLYTNVERNVLSISPINILGNESNNNTLFMYNNTHNNMKNVELLKEVHELFNNYKYSLFIPLQMAIINIMIKITPFNFIEYIINILSKRIDYIYTNIIGPTHDIIEDVHFLISPLHSEIIYNIISSADNVNIIISYKEGVIQDKARFEECIYRAYDSLIESTL